MAEKNQDISSESITRKQHFLKLATQNLVRNGGIATVQADYLRRMLTALKLEAEFTILPGSTTVYMRDDVSPAQGVNVLTFKTGLGYNLDKLEDVEAVINDALEGRLYGGMDEALSGLERIQKRPNQYGAWVHPIGWSLIGGLVTVLLGGRLIDGAVSLFTGGVFGCALVLCDYIPALGHTFDFWVSYLVGLLLAVVQAYILPSLVFWPCFLASVILILPGFSMAMGFTDVFSRQTCFGLATLFNAAWAALAIGMGAFLGVCSVSALAGKSVVTLLGVSNPGVPTWAHMLIYPAFNVLLNMTFQAKPSQALIIAPMATAAFGLFMLLMQPMFSFGNEPNILLSVLLMSATGHIFGRLTRGSELPTVLSGIIVFAPGTFGARSCYYALTAARAGMGSGDVISALYALSQAASMLSISAAMAIGLLLGRALFGKL